MKTSDQPVKTCLFSYAPALDSGENLERMAASYEKLSRNRKGLTPRQKRLRELYETLLLLLVRIDWDEPYAVDLERIYNKVLERGRFNEDLSSRQRQETLTIACLAVAEEAMRRHEEAVTGRDWEHIDYTLRQLKNLFRQFANLAYGGAEYRIAKVRKYRQSGQKAKGVQRSHGHNWDEICQRYDELMSQGSERDFVTRRLSSSFDIRKDVLNRGLRQRGRGSKA